MIPFMGETVYRAFNFVFIPVFLLLLNLLYKKKKEKKYRTLIYTTRVGKYAVLMENVIIAI